MCRFLAPHAPYAFGATLYFIIKKQLCQSAVKQLEIKACISYFTGYPKLGFFLPQLFIGEEKSRAFSTIFKVRPQK
jgi:hypothetical protein